MKKLLYILLPVLFCFQACNLEDESEFEYDQSNVLAIDLMPAAMNQLAYNQSALHGRTSGGIMQYYESLDSRVVFDNFNLPSDYFDGTWENGYYGGSLASANEMKELAIEEGDNNIQAISLILLANEFSVLTNTFGDIPFNESLMGADNITPKFDVQQEIYTGIIQMLDEAIQLIGSNGVVSGLNQSDLIYGGDMQAWKRFANGLKARSLLNQRNRVAGMESEILNLIEASFADRGQQADFNFTNEKANPLAKFGDERPSTLLMNQNFINILVVTDDPRFSSYAYSDFPDWQYYGEPEMVWAQFDSSIPLLSYTELMFIKAEVMLHIGEPNDSVSAALEEAILSSMDDNNVGVDPNVQSYVSAASDLAGLDSEESLQKIIEQAYVSYYGYNFQQAWNNYRRTGYPEITIPSTDPNPNNPSNVIPRRLLYPQNEFDYNEANVQEAISRQGGALMDNDFWIFE